MDINPRTGQRLLLILVLLVTLGIAAFTNFTPRNDRAPQRAPQQRSTALDEQFNRDFAGQGVEDLPLGNLREKLGANEIIYKRVKGIDISFEMYIAKWSAGNIFAFEAGRHPPDLCWPAWGWVCEAKESRVAFRSGVAMLLPGEWRRFRAANGSVQHVLFWCLIGRSPLHLQYDDPPPRHSGSIRNLFAESEFLQHWYHGLIGSAVSESSNSPEIPVPNQRDVYFVRVNSCESVDSVMQSNIFDRAHPFLAELGLLN